MIYPAVDRDGMPWELSARCRDTDPDAFFPEGESTQATYNQTARLCAECPVRVECLDFALTTNRADGMWGGTTPHQRERLRRERGLTSTLHEVNRRRWDERDRLDDRILPTYERRMVVDGGAHIMASEMGVSADSLNRRMKRARQRRESAA